jgi:hypothetical protein
MVNPENPGQKQGMSTQKKWLIGCGGCLGVLLLIAVVLAVLAGMGVDALKNVSNQSVTEIFGKEFKPEPYKAMGLPLGQKNLKNMVLLIEPKSGRTLFAVDTALSPSDAQQLESTDPKHIEAFLKHMSEEITSHSSRTSSSRLRNIRFDATTTITLPNGKHLPLTKATVEAERHGAVAYSPAVATLIPEANHRLITLISLDPNSGSSQANTDFSDTQADLQKELVHIISNSALDDRLLSTESSQKETP